MSKKKEPSIDDAVEIFNDVMSRSSLTDYFYVNKKMISKNPKDQSVIIIPDQLLWNKLMELESFNKHIQEIDLKDAVQYQLAQMINLIDDTLEGWTDLDTESLYKGEVLKIKIDGYEYDIQITKALIPLRLKKAEFNSISYRLYLPDNRKILALKKRFNFILEGGGFSMIRLFQI